MISSSTLEIVHQLRVFLMGLSKCSMSDPTFFRTIEKRHRFGNLYDEQPRFAGLEAEYLQEDTSDIN